MKKMYAGVGSRKAPQEVLGLMERIARRLAVLGWMLRTGGAEGADQAFERGARAGGGTAEVFLPWPGYNGYQAATLDRFRCLAPFGIPQDQKGGKTREDVWKT